jgi:hypothetical protein
VNEHGRFGGLKVEGLKVGRFEGGKVWRLGGLEVGLGVGRCKGGNM